jgi:hypothetical protein
MDIYALLPFIRVINIIPSLGVVGAAAKSLVLIPALPLLSL